MIGPGQILWFVRHEARLAWRDMLTLLSGGRARRTHWVVLGVIVFIAVLHLIALSVVSAYDMANATQDKSTLTIVTALAFGSWMLMLSQAMEAVTRAFYSRADFDLVLTSPAPSGILFSIRIIAIAMVAVMVALVLAGPFIDALVLTGGAQFLGAYGLVLAMGTSATALAILICLLLFRFIGRRRTRFFAQILAAIIGAGFVIGLQLAAILTMGSAAQIPFLQSRAVIDKLPAPDSSFWLPARAALGDPFALALVIGVGLTGLAAVAWIFAGSFASHAIAAAGTPERRSLAARPAVFRPTSIGQALRRKEWMLLRRDPWLASQTLMQLLYLAPPAFLLWRNLGGHTGIASVVAPVLVMAAGQLAGGLAWLAISGEDAPELIATAPARPSQILQAKVEAVLGCVGLVFLPLLLTMALISPANALIASGGILVSAGSATLIQLRFRGQAKRSQFRRRQTSSRLATIAEAFATIGWAGTIGLLETGSWLALPSGGISVLVLGCVWLASPRGRRESYSGTEITAKAGIALPA